MCLPVRQSEQRVCAARSREHFTEGGEWAGTVQCGIDRYLPGHQCLIGRSDDPEVAGYPTAADLALNIR
jgi:hypothetical protein